MATRAGTLPDGHTPRMRSGEGTAEPISDPGKEARAEAGLPVVPVFDGYRAFAILAVVAIHLLQLTGTAGDGGTLGSRVLLGTIGRAVEILFVVSGFVVFLPTVARGGVFGSIRGFAIRRAARLFPAYWLALLLCVVLIALFDLANPLVPDRILALPSVGAFLLDFTALSVPARFFLTDVPIGAGLDTPMWTLSSEVTFYFLLPLVAVAFFRFPRTGLVIAATITVLWTLAFENVAQLAADLGSGIGLGEAVRLKLIATQQFPTCAFSFGLGMAGAVAWVRLSRGEHPRLRARADLVSAVALVVFVVCSLVLGDDDSLARSSLLWSMAYSVAVATLMVSLALGSEAPRRPFAAPRVRALGDISYGIYLSHFPIIALVFATVDLAGMSDLARLAVLTAITLPAAALYGYLSARYLEQPIRRWARRYGRQGEGDAGRHIP